MPVSLSITLVSAPPPGVLNCGISPEAGGSIPAPEFADIVGGFVLEGQTARLTQAALETLAVIAYRQPVSRARVSAIRGVNVDSVVRTLTQRGLIEDAGTDPESGAILYRTTSYFLERMGIGSVAELPQLSPTFRGWKASRSSTTQQECRQEQLPAHEYPPGQIEFCPSWRVLSGDSGRRPTNEGRVMTQAGRQGSPRNSSGRNSAGQSSAGRNSAGQRTPAQGSGRGAQGGGGRSGGAGFKGGGARPFKHPKPREEAFIDPDLQGPDGTPPAGRPASGDWKSKAPSGKEAARKACRPQARLRQGPRHPGRPQAQAAHRRRSGQGHRFPRVRQRTLRAEPRARAQAGPQARTPRRGAPVRTARRRTASACRRSWPRPASPHGASAKK